MKKLQALLWAVITGVFGVSVLVNLYNLVVRLMAARWLDAFSSFLLAIGCLAIAAIFLRGCLRAFGK